MSKLETITIDTPSGSSALQIGDGNTATIGLGKSGDTINIPSGATIANAGTATGFGGTNENLFNAYRNGSFSINHDTWTNVNFNAEAFDLDSKFDVSNGRYTPASTGYYKFNASVVIEFNSSNLGRRVGIRLLKNGNTVAENFQKISNSSELMQQHSVTLSFIDYTSSTSDYYMIYALQNNANSNNSAEIITDSYNTYFSGYKLIR
tara:strand:+ start:23 stop:640 length:618 start_codon:yes stop_codon:yes gene_type:complete